jgi:hypothetical protein
MFYRQKKSPKQFLFYGLIHNELKQMDAIQFGLDATNHTLLSTYNALVRAVEKHRCL